MAKEEEVEGDLCPAAALGHVLRFWALLKPLLDGRGCWAFGLLRAVTKLEHGKGAMLGPTRFGEGSG